MKQEKPDNTVDSQGRDAVELLTRTGMLAGSLYAAITGHQVEAGLGFGATESAALTAGRLYAALSERVARLTRKSGHRVSQRLAAAGAEPDLEVMEDLLQRAIPSITQSGTDQQRQMVEDVLFNAAVRWENEAEVAEAFDMLQLVGQITPTAALILRDLNGDLDHVEGQDEMWRYAPTSGIFVSAVPSQLNAGLIHLHSLGLLGSTEFSGKLAVNFTSKGWRLRYWLSARQQ